MITIARLHIYIYTYIYICMHTDSNKTIWGYDEKECWATHMNVLRRWGEAEERKATGVDDLSRWYEEEERKATHANDLKWGGEAKESQKRPLHSHEWSEDIKGKPRPRSRVNDPRLLCGNFKLIKKNKGIADYSFFGGSGLEGAMTSKVSEFDLHIWVAGQRWNNMLANMN